MLHFSYPRAIVIGTLLSVAAMFAVGCGDDDPGDASKADAGADSAAPCTRDVDCTSGRFCDGAGTCDPSATGADARGCVVVAPCLATQACSEATRACISDCVVEPDADGDGVDAVSCGGQDCDDSDGARFPGNTETCDSAGRDEDCNPATLAGTDGDRDGDGFVSSSCCFLPIAGADLQCGFDCDDDAAGVRPGAIEVCNGQDDNCNGFLDGPSEDSDADGFANDVCAGAASSDCDDNAPSAHLGAPEICNGRDDDCMIGGVRRRAGEPRAEFAEDLDGDGHSPSAATCTAIPPAGATAFAKDDCDDTLATVFGGARELCNAVDDDCNGTIDDRAGAAGLACLPTQIGLGGRHSCVIESDGSLDCFGDNGCGQLGDIGAPAGLVVHTALPSPAVEVDGGGDYTCARSMDGTISCFGSDGLLSARSNPFSSPACGGLGLVPSLGGPATDLAAGSAHACAIVGGLVKCWGFSAFHALDPAVAGSVDEWFTPVTVSGLSGVTHIDVGNGRSCAVHSGGSVRCFGANFEGELGPPANTHVFDVPITNATRVAVGAYAYCALRTDGTVACWGTNESGALGCGTAPGCPPVGSEAINRTTTPVQVSGLSDVVDIQAGSGRSMCARSRSGVVWCWGANDFNQLGDDSYVSGTGSVATSTTVPVRARSTDGATMIAVGGDHACVLASDRLRCFGRGSELQLGDGQVDHSVPPHRTQARVSVFSFAIHTALSAQASCFITPTREIRCAGDPLGIGSGSGYSTFPLPAYGLDAFSSVDLRTTGAIRSSQTGIVSSAEQRRGYGPFAISGFQVAAGDKHFCSRSADGILSCWGANDDGQVGDGTTLRFVETPSSIAFVEPVREVVAGSDFTCARTPSTTSCWGRGTAGQLASLPVGSTATPRPITMLPAPAVDLAAGDDSACAVLASGEVACWGAALGPFAASNTPTVILDLTDAVQVAVGASSACARRENGRVVCWGSGANGRLGTGAMTSSATPLRVTYLEDAVDIACGANHCCAARACGQSVCWGASGEWLAPGGDPVPPDSATPRGVAGMYAF